MLALCLMTEYFLQYIVGRGKKVHNFGHYIGWPPITYAFWCSQPCVGSSHTDSVIGYVTCLDQWKLTSRGLSFWKECLFLEALAPICEEVYLSYWWARGRDKCLTAPISPSHPRRGTRHVSDKVTLDVPALADTHGTEQLSRLAQPRLLSSNSLLL